MNKEQIREYSMRISQSNRTQVVVITYEIIINYLDSGRVCLDNGNDTEFVFNVKKARQFVNQLSSALDFKYEISYELMNLYMYASDCLLKSELRREDVNLSTVRNMMEKLREAFAKVSESDNSGAVMQGGEKVYAGLTYGKNAQGTVMVSK
jgi:flagellar protein FliS